MNRIGLAAAARQKIWNDGCLLGNCTLCSVERRNMSILKGLAKDASINANGGSQEVWTAPLAALPHGRKEPTLPYFCDAADGRFGETDKVLPE